ncbi:hypothetical protein BD779DRAFT_1464913 [Infundibulicybe gibba]|nr:hypothetical protein BD779DRAFT_1464913 [Infundibulicybe gibba]
MWVQTADARTALLAVYFTRYPLAGDDTRSKTHKVPSHRQQDNTGKTKHKPLGKCEAGGRIASRAVMGGYQTTLGIKGKTIYGESGRLSRKLARKELKYQVGRFRTRGNESRSNTSAETRGNANPPLKMDHRVLECEVESWAVSTPELSPSRSSDSEASVSPPREWRTESYIHDKADEMFEMFIDVGKCGDFLHVN